MHQLEIWLKRRHSTFLYSHQPVLVPSMWPESIDFTKKADEGGVQTRKTIGKKCEILYLANKNDNCFPSEISNESE